MDHRQLVRQRDRLADLERGGSPDYPILVPSASVIDRRAEWTPCVQCRGEYKVIDHEFEMGIRVVSVKCRQCGAHRRMWFRIVEPTSN